MKAQPIPFVGGAYADETRPWSQQDTCNYLPCKAERSGARSDEMLKTPPGLKPFAEVIITVEQGGELPSFVEYTPVRGIHEAEGKLFAVIGPTMYRITSAGVAIPLGTVPGTGRVVMAHNQISLGNEILAVNGSAGYTYNTVTDTFARIDDPGYPGSSVAVFIDGYLVQVEPQGRFAFNSDVAQAREYNTLDRFTSEVTPDRIVSLAVTGNELMVLSASSCEFFQNTGASEQPFRSKRISFEKGCAGAYCVAQADNTVFWLGSDGSFYQLQGYTPVRISTRPIEQAIRGLDWTQAFAFVWDDAGHEVVYWTFPDGKTWGYDVSQQEWHRRESYGLDRWRVTGTAYWNNKWYAGDFQKGRIWELNWDYVLEGDQEFVSSRTIPVIHDNQSRILIPRLELVMDTGRPLVEPIAFGEQPTGPTISDAAPDGAEGFAYTHTYTLTGAATPLIVTLRSGTLPAGLSLSAAGVLSGTPTAGGTSVFTVRVTDANGLYDDLDESVAIEQPSMLVTNRAFYTGLPESLTKQTEDYDFTTAHDRYRLSPTGQYLAAIDRGGAAATRLEITKYDPDTGTWTLIAPPSTLPVGTCRDLAWHPSGDYLTVTSVGTTAVDSMVTYKRVGDVFTPIADPGTALTNAASTVVWDSTGERLAVQQANSGARIAFYEFDATTDTYGTKTVTPNLGADDNDFLRFDFMPGADSPYFVASGATRIVVLAQQEGPIRKAAVATGAAGVGCFFIAESAYVAVIGNGDAGVAEGRIFAFDDTTSAESLTLSSDFAVQPTGVPSDASITSDRRYLAIGADSGNSPQIYDFGTASVPVATKLTDPTASSNVVAFVSWGPLYE